MEGGEIKVIPMEEPRRGWRERGQTMFAAPRSGLAGFADFIRERGVMGLAIGFVLGTSVQKVVTAFVNDIVNPFVGIVMGRADGIKNFAVGPFLVGDFISVAIDFIFLVAIIYFIFRGLGLDKLDKKAE